MIFPYLYIDMSLKHVIILSLLSLSAVAGQAQSLKDTVRFNDGSIYIGQIADSLFNGHGMMIYADSTVYEGEWKDGMWNGQGEIRYPDGDHYTGSFKDHEFSGYGKYFYADGGKYEGYWERGMYNGNGTMEYADGTIYSGEWKDDKKEGLGVLYMSSANNLLKGYFRNDYFYGPIEQENNSDRVQIIAQSGNPQTAAKTKDDGKFHYAQWNSRVTVSLSYGLGNIFAVHTDFHASEWFFVGGQLGFNTIDHTKGEVSVIYDNETGEKTTLVGWDWYMDEVLTEETFNMFKIAAECGVSWRRVSLGTALGLAVENCVRNCRSKEENDSFFEPGTFYYRTNITGAKFAYDIYTQYVFNVPLPFADYISIRAGYSNIDEFHMGIGILF